MTDDLISRQMAIDALGKEGLITAMIVVDNVPSAQTSDIAKDIAQIIKNELDMHELLKPAQRKIGKWIYTGIRGRFPACQCSECGNTENADWASMQGVDYCPHCGAYMKGES